MDYNIINDSLLMTRKKIDSPNLSIARKNVFPKLTIFRNFLPKKEQIETEKLKVRIGNSIL